MRTAVGGFLLGALVCFLASCSDSGVTADPTTVNVDTMVDKHFLNAGETFTVSCIVTDPEGRQVKVDTAFVVTPGDGVAINGANVTPASPGEYVVTCMLPDGSKADETPEVVLVTLNDVSEVETVLDRNEVVAGEKALATCIVKNLNGEIVERKTEVISSPAVGLKIEDHTVTGITVGEYAVACKVVDLPIVDTTPEGFIVTAGNPAVVRATIKEEEVTAGSEVVVFCTVEDKYGNVLDLPAVVDPQEGIETNGTKIVPKVAGEYDITCSVKDKELEKVPDHLTVSPGPIASVLMEAKPSKKGYKVGDKVTVTARAADAYGNPVEGVDGFITAPEGMKKAGEKWEFTAEGVFKFTAVLEPPYDYITGELVLICDETGPEITVLKPQRAATLTGKKMIDVEGNASDLLSSEVQLKINNKDVPVGQDGKFYHIVEAAHGINMLSIEAWDGFNNKSHVVQSFEFSSDYVNFATGNVVDTLLEQSLLIYLGQNFLDDGDHDKKHPDDVATLVEILLDSISLDLLGGDLPIVDTVIPGVVKYDLVNIAGFNFTLFGDLGITVWVKGVSFAEPHVAIKTREGGVDMTVSFKGSPEDPGVFVQLYVELTFPLTVQSTLGGNQLFSAGITPGVAVETSASIEALLIETSIDMNKEVGEELSVKVGELKAVPVGIHIEPMEDLKVDLGQVVFNNQGVYDLPVVELGELVSGVNDILSSYIIDPMLNFVIPAALDLLQPVIEDQVSDLLGNLLNQFEVQLPLPIPQIPGAKQAVEVTFMTKLSSVHFSEAGGELGMAAGFMAPKGIDREVLGSILRAGCLGGAYGTPEFNTAEKFEVAAALDIINELLFALWWGGGLGLAIDSSLLKGLPIDKFGISDLALGADFLLSPILDDCTAKGMVEAQVGDLFLQPSFSAMGSPVAVKLYATAALDAVLFGENNEIGLKILGVTDLGVQIVSVQGDLGPLAGMFDIEDLIENVLIPMVISQVSNLTLGSFPLPEIDLSSLVPGVPPGTMLSLTNLSVDMSHGYLVFSGELQ